MNPTPTPTAAAMYALASAADWWIVWLTGFGVIATLVIAFFTYRANVKADSARLDATKALALAVDATRSSSAKQVETLEALVDRLNAAPVDSPAEAAPAAPPVQWHLEKVGPDGWLLRNVGRDTARDAIVSPLLEQDALTVNVPFKVPMDVPPGSTLPFSISRTFASPPATVVNVQWLDGSRYGQAMSFVVR